MACCCAHLFGLSAPRRGLGLFAALLNGTLDSGRIVNFSPDRFVLSPNEAAGLV